MNICSAHYCKDCSHFFSVREIELKCPRCDKKRLSISDFPMPDGSIVFQCAGCKKMFSLKDVCEHNKEILSKG